MRKLKTPTWNKKSILYTHTLASKQGWIGIHVFFHFVVVDPAGIPAWATPYAEHEPKILLHIFHVD